MSFRREPKYIVSNLFEINNVPDGPDRTGPEYDGGTG